MSGTRFSSCVLESLTFHWRLLQAAACLSLRSRKCCPSCHSSRNCLSVKMCTKTKTPFNYPGSGVRPKFQRIRCPARGCLNPSAKHSTLCRRVALAQGFRIGFRVWGSGLWFKTEFMVCSRAPILFPTPGGVGLRGYEVSYLRAYGSVKRGLGFAVQGLWRGLSL